MQNFTSIDPASATGKTKQIFDGFQKALGTVPNLLKVLASSPAALKAYVNFDAALHEGTLPAKTREQIAISVANANSCDYCLSAHTALGQLAGLNADELTRAQSADSPDPKTSAALHFALKLVQQRGLVQPSEVDALRAAGYTDGQITEIVATVAINIFTNYFNHIAGTEIDFPIVKSASAAH